MPNCISARHVPSWRSGSQRGGRAIASAVLHLRKRGSHSPALRRPCCQSFLPCGQFVVALLAAEIAAAPLDNLVRPNKLGDVACCYCSPSGLRPEYQTLRDDLIPAFKLHPMPSRTIIVILVAAVCRLCSSCRCRCHNRAVGTTCGPCLRNFLVWFVPDLRSQGANGYREI